VVEYFDKGRMPRGETPDGLRKLEFWTNENRRLLEFYPGARIDGLVRREDRFGSKTIENFQYHDERLSRRTIQYSITAGRDVTSRFGQSWVPDNQCTEIHKVKEIYERNQNVEADDDIHQLKYFVGATGGHSSGQVGRIEVDYQYTQCRITHSRRVYNKDGLIDDELVMVDPYAQKPKWAQTQDDLKELQARFQVTNQSIREMDRNITELMKYRSIEEEPNRIEVVTHVYDASRAKGDDDVKEEAQEEEEEEFDPLKAFLPANYSAAEHGPLGQKDAERVKKDCLSNLKQRLVERKEIIENRLLEQQNELDRTKQTFARTKDQLDPAAIENHETAEKDMLFKINILQMRLEKHNEDAFGKLNDLYGRLKTDERLALLYQ